MSLRDRLGSVAGSVSKGIGSVVQGVGNATKELGDYLTGDSGDEDGSVVKCPHCGEQMSTLASVCPSCGLEIQSVGTAGAVSRLAAEIHRLESKRNIRKEERTRVSQTDEKIASLVRNFVVPNNKDDIFEFMMMASGNIDAYRGKKTGSPKVVIQAWEAKFEQTYLKAQSVFGNQSDFQMIQNIYDTQKAKTEKSGFFFRRR